MTTETRSEINGWNLADIEEAVSMIEAEPEAGKLVWRSRASWDAGFGLDVRTESIEQLGDQMHRAFTMRGDHPPELLGENTGPTAVETLLAALGACVTGTFAAQATVRGIDIRDMELEIVGSIDLNGFFGLRPIAPGLSDVELKLRVCSDAPTDTLEEVLNATKELSPVFDSVTRPIEVATSVEAIGD